MSSNTIASAAEFVRMTKEEKLRFCQDLIRQAANLKKSSRTSGSVRSKSKSNKRSNSKRAKTPTSTYQKHSKSSALQSSEHTPIQVRSKMSPSHSSVKNSTGSNSKIDGMHTSKTNQSEAEHQPTSKSSIHSHKSTRKHHPDGSSLVRSASHTAGAHAKSRTKSKPTGRSHSRLRRGASRVRSASKHKRSTKSVTEKKRRTSTVRLSSKPAGYSSKHAGKTRSTATRGHIRSKSKHANTQRKTHTEICAVQFVPKFDPSSSKNHVPIYHLIRHAFGNMVREAICQLDKDKTGVSSQQILDHILKHYSFPNNISKSAIRNRTLFTINAGLRAGTLLSAGSNKNIRIGRMRRVYPHKLR
ncbi:unnamed protein product [Adineta ricciae]|uniref:Uncharacterized protein n=1 Tax=Adineta ricciae TaxID=249248 RepID=A0A815JBG4_ADIRI|nr:unnamed protein product [Adineta ricciae]